MEIKFLEHKTGSNMPLSIYETVASKLYIIGEKKYIR